MLNESDFHRRMVAHIEEVNQTLTRLYEAEPLDPSPIADQYADYAEKLREYIGDTSALVWEALRRGQSVLAEGAQGTLLDLDHGTYPFVTSSSPLATGVMGGLGIGVGHVGRVIGVTKAFQSRVGAGPFPTEVQGDTAVRLRGTGANPWDEFGTTTGRPRRVGWLDGVLLRYAVRINGLTELVVTKLDVLSGLPEVRVCVAYRANGREYSDLPLGPADLSPFEPVYEDMPGWDADLTGVRSWGDLPAAAQNYLARISELERRAGLPGVGRPRTGTGGGRVKFGLIAALVLFAGVLGGCLPAPSTPLVSTSTPTPHPGTHHHPGVVSRHANLHPAAPAHAPPHRATAPGRGSTGARRLVLRQRLADR